MELYLIELNNKKEAYVMAEDEGHARDKAGDWIKERFFAGPKVSIQSIKLIAEVKSKGRTKKLLL